MAPTRPAPFADACRAAAILFGLFAIISAIAPAPARAESITNLPISGPAADRLRAGGLQKPPPPPDTRGAASTTRQQGQAGRPPAPPGAQRTAGGAAEGPAEDSTGRPADGSPEGVVVRFAWAAGDAVFLRGEQEARIFPVTIPDPRGLGRAVLSVGFRNGADVRPDSSRLQIRINDRHLVSLRLASVSGDTRARIRLPTGALRPGRNHIAFEADHRHRTSCTLEATYELWTRLSTDLTALHLAAGPEPAPVGRDDYDDWLRLYAGGGHPFTIALATGGADTGALRWAGLVAQGIGLRLGDMPPKIHLRLPSTAQPPALRISGLRSLETEAAPADQPLLALVGTRDDLADQLSDSVYAAIQGALWTFVPVARSAGQLPVPPVLLVTGRTRHETLSAARAFAAVSAETRADQARPDPDVSTYHFEKLILGPWANNAVRGRLALPIRLPPDAFTATDASVLMGIDGRISPAVGAEADLLVRVNGTVAGWYPFRHTTDGTLRGPPVTVPLRAFRPGFNQVDLTARLPKGDTEACPAPVADHHPGPDSTAAKESRLFLQETSALLWPPVTRLAALPNLSATAGWGTPYYAAERSEPFDVYLAATGETTLSAALTLLARLAQAAATPLTTLFTFDAPGLSDRNLLAIGAIGDLPASLLARAPIDRETLQRRLIAAPFHTEEPAAQPRAEPPAIPEALRLRMRAAGHFGSLPSAAGPGTGPGTGIGSGPDGPGGGDARTPDVVADAGGPLTTLRRRATALLHHLREKLQGAAGGPSATEWLLAYDGPIAALVLQMRSPQAQGRTWTVVTAADQASLGRSVAALVTPRLWTRLDGAVTVFDDRSGSVGHYHSAALHYPNLRLTDPAVLLLVTGTWFSRNTLLLLGAVAALVLIFSILTHRLVSHEG